MQTKRLGISFAGPCVSIALILTSTRHFRTLIRHFDVLERKFQENMPFEMTGSSRVVYNANMNATNNFRM